MKGYTFLEDLTSDVMFEAKGSTLQEVLETSAKAMFSVICDIKHIKPEKQLNINIQAENEEKLLYEFLSTLLTESEIEGLFLKLFNIKGIQKKGNEYSLQAEAFGEPLSPEKGGTVVKGITYYGLKLEKIKKGYKARVAMDI